MNARQAKILEVVIEKYIDLAEPVGSNLIAKKFKLSPATLRNEMKELEEKGFLYQPHTSAGRVPTNKGLRFYAHKLYQKSLKSRLNALKMLRKFKSDQEEFLEKSLKLLSRASNNVAIGLLPGSEALHFGLSKILSQPEFLKHENILRAAMILDKLDNFMTAVLKNCKGHLEILIGEEIPYRHAENFGLIIKKFPVGEKTGAIGVLGPARMPYPKLISVLEEITSIFKECYE